MYAFGDDDNDRKTNVGAGVHACAHKLSDYFSLTCTNSNVRGRQGNKGLTSCIASGRMTSISEYQTPFLEELNPIGNFFLLEASLSDKDPIGVDFEQDFRVDVSVGAEFSG